MGFSKRFCFLFFVCLLFVFLSQPHLFANSGQLTIEQELSKATKKSSTGAIMAIIGSTIFAYSMVLTFSDKKQIPEVGIGEDWSVSVKSNRVKDIYIVGDVLGLIIAGTGLIIHLPARKEIKRLESQRDLTSQVAFGMLPEYRAMGMKITINW